MKKSLIDDILLLLPSLFLTGIIPCGSLFAQNDRDPGSIHGNFEVTSQYYRPDTIIGAPHVPEKLLMNSFANLIFTKGNFEAGIRYEGYLNTLQGFDPRYEGVGIPFRYAKYTIDGLEVTAGSFYEQFGTGLIFRSYEERGLGVDNAMDGARLRYSPLKGIYLKGFIGKQRYFMAHGPGIVRGIDSEVAVNELSEKLGDMKTKIVLGGSFVSKYQEDRDPIYRLPENVGASAARLQLTHGKLAFMGEYAYKINDPSQDNGFIYKPGQGLFLSTSYAQKGLGINLSAKSIDNMSYRSDRMESVNNLMVNFLPALTRQHVYNLPATLYPYATQPNGEVAVQADVVYTVKKGSKLGGKYGTIIALNFSGVNNIDTVGLNDMEGRRHGYKTRFFKPGKEAYFRDFNLEITRKISKKFKVKAAYVNLVYDMEVVQGLGGMPTVYADMGILDLLYKFDRKHSVRLEAQHLSTKQDDGSWATLIAEYSFAPHWFIGFMDQYNYGNPESDKRIHYMIGTAGYTKNANRFMLTYGRQRAGIFCVGGVCRNVPASNGITFTVTSSF